MSSAEDGTEAAVVAAFLNLVLEDRQRGAERTLSDYQRRFAGFEQAIAAEYARLADGPDGATGATDSVAASLGPIAASGPLIEGPIANRYRDESELAHGGMGTILQVVDPVLRRTVAKKVLTQSGAQAGLGSMLVERFLAEAKVTAQLEHPGIVPVHELGIDARGRVYFTMSLVHGRDFREILGLVRADRDGWNRTRALGVLQRVCEAVAFAHSRGVIHRDLKPANVMVGRFGETYVLDWGLARAVGAPADADADGAAPGPDATTSMTLDGDVIGTPAYMAPEQARGDLARIGPCTDVFAIGAMLYHLLAGCVPYADVGTNTWQAMLAANLSGPPTSLRRISRHVPEELVAICERAMARDPAARYATAGELGEDIRAFLEIRVVRAHRTGALAELSKWVRRNRFASAAAALAALSLTAGLLTSLWLKGVADDNAARTQVALVAANDANHAAERELDIRAAVLDFLNHDLLAAVAPGAVGKDASMREVLAAASQGIEGKFAGRPLVEAAVRTTLGDTYRRLGALDEAEQHLLRAVELHAGVDENAVESLKAKRMLAITYRAQTRVDEAVQLNREILATSRELFGPTHADTLSAANNLGLALLQLGRYEEAEPLLVEVYEQRRRTIGAEHDHTLVSMCNLGLLYYETQRYEQAEPLIRGELELCVAKHGEQHPETLSSRNNYANLLGAMGRNEEALSQTERIVRSSEAVLGEEHHDTVLSLFNRAVLQQRLGRADEAVETLRVAGSRAVGLGPEHGLCLLIDYLRADLLSEQGDAGAALAVIDDLVARYRRVEGPRSPGTQRACELHAKVLVAVGRGDEALRQLERTLADAGDQESGQVAILRFRCGVLLLDAGRVADAERELLAVERYAAARGRGSELRREVIGALVRLYESAGNPDEAERWRSRLP
jgi:tetratricopeptide (TPR) repeat protein